MKLNELHAVLKADLQRFAIPGSEQPVNWLNLLNPRFIPVLIIRLARYFSFIPVLKLLAPMLTWMNVILYGVEFTTKCEVGPGLMLPHTVGTVVGAKRIGSNVTIFQGVTLGAKYIDLEFDETKRPTILDNVSIGAGAKVLGGITLGVGAKVAPNAVVFNDVPERAIAIGNPAQIQIPVVSNKEV